MNAKWVHSRNLGEGWAARRGSRETTPKRPHKPRQPQRLKSRRRLQSTPRASRPGAPQSEFRGYEADSLAGYLEILQRDKNPRQRKKDRSFLRYAFQGCGLRRPWRLVDRDKKTALTPRPSEVFEKRPSCTVNSPAATQPYRN